MQAGAIVVIWTLASELSAPATNALTSAAGEALGSDTELRVAAAPDPEGMRLDDARDASAVVRLTWDEAEHRRARLMCFIRNSKRFVDREVVFDPSDPERERGRTLGFLVASMLINANAEQGARAESPPLPERPSSHRDEAHDPAAMHAAVTTPKNALLAAAEFANADPVVGFGFWFAGERALTHRLWLGASVHARFGSIEEAQARSRLLGAGLHLNWLVLRAGPVWAGARVGCSVAQIEVTRLVESSGGGTQSHSRVLPSAELTAHAGYHLSAASALSLQLGGEFLSGVTAISVAEREVASWPWAAFLARMGVETVF